ncbi:MAG: methyltransferase domain-containing protein [Pirellulaceae bacterium]
MARKPPDFARTLPCDLCGHQEFELVAKRDRHGQPLPTVVCCHCGLLTHAQVPSEDELNDYYQHQYRFEYHGQYAPAPHRVIREWNRAERLTRLLTPWLCAQDRIVEVGCGMGCTVKNLELAGFQATGLEPGDGFRRFAREQLHACVEPGVLAGMRRQACCDVLLLVHVLEHLRSPSEALRHLRANLTDRGRLYVEVPNAGAPHAAPHRMFHRAHIYNFTRYTLAMLAEKCGFRVAEWLSEEGAKNLKLLLACRSETNWQVTPASYPHTLRALGDFNRVTYCLRWCYMRQRLHTLVTQPCDRILSRYRLQRILRICRPHQAGSLPVRRCCSRSSAII